ncbi:MAG: DUF1800 domain-containing protein [Candidatus Obscuribacterales bacterium]|nr:DUF1800 domain-containing protein [Candidatus Obscuribacterales bacterium]
MKASFINAKAGKALRFSALAYSIALLLPPTLAAFAANGPDARSQKQEAKSSGQASQKRTYDNKEILHMLNRVSFGPAPGDLERVKRMGVEAYLKEQLNPSSIQQPEELEKICNVPALTESPAQLFLTYGRPALKAIATKSGSDNPADKKELQKALRESYQFLYEDTARARLARAVESPAQLQEVMTDFWYNHFNISVDKNLDHLWVGSFEEAAIRPHALGKFRDLLGATAHHAAMLFYLDNWQNTSADSPMAKGRKGRFQGINENYARELMELHTLGVDGGYTQKDVQELARVLTGLGLPPGAGGGFGNNNPAQRLKDAAELGQGDMSMQLQRRAQGRQGIFETGAAMAGKPDLNNKLGSYFDSRRHDFGKKLILGYRIDGSGEDEIEQVLTILAKQPATAKHISYKLAQYFVSDTPSAELVDKLANRYLESDGDISAILNTLFHSQEFWDSKAINAKFKSPYRYLISSLRATNGQIDNVKPSLGVLSQLGMPLYKCLTPDGYKNTKEAWLNPDNLLNRINFATAYGVGRFPGIKPNLRDPAAVADCLGPTLSDQTLDTVMSAPENMRISLLLGSPEFMKY